MCKALLGATVDIHGGGADLQFPHHENEIAQSEGASGRPLARYWMHNGFINIDNEKMSKSLGNFFTIRDVLERYEAETLRFFMVRSHYRSPVNYSDVHLDDARQGLRRLYTTLDNTPPSEGPTEMDAADPWWTRFKAAMDEDFATPEAVAVLFDLAAEVNRTRDGQLAYRLKALGSILGLLQAQPRLFLQGGQPGDDVAHIDALIERRAQAKQARDFVGADAVRAELAALGVVVKDTPSGTVWVRQ
jgi:cysteinyl-tRNA synthetase